MTFDVSLLPPATRWYPIEVHTHGIYVAWIEGDSAKQAAENAQYEEGLIDGLSPTDDWADYNPADEHSDLYLSAPGPHAACPECGAVEREVGQLIWAGHLGTCPWHVHHPDITFVRDEQHQPAGWLTRCSCAEPGFDAPFLSITTMEVGDRTIHPDRQSAGRVLREHVEGRWHSKHVPLGITDESYPDRIERSLAA